MTFRRTLRRSASLLLLLVAGCLYPSQKKIDLTVCDISLEPRDRQQPLTPTDQSPMPRAADSEATTAGFNPEEAAEVVPTSAVELSSSPGGRAFGTTTSSEARPQRYPLVVPGDLLPVGKKVPAIRPPREFLPNGKRNPEYPNHAAYLAARRSYFKALFPPLPPLSPNPRAQPGPQGRPLTLAQLQQLGLANSPLIKQAVANVEAMRGAAVQAGLPPNPTVGFEADTFGTTGGAGYQGGFVEQLIKTANKLELARASATMDLRNAEVALRRAQMDLATRIRAGYFNLLVAQESMRVNLALTRFTMDIYNVQMLMFQSGEGFAAPYEPMYLRGLIVPAKTALIQARMQYISAWKQLAAAMGVPGMPLTQVEGRIDMAIPDYNYKAVLARVLAIHTDVLTAQNSLQQARINLALARVTPIPDVDVRFLLQRDYTGAPFEMAPSVQVSMPIPIWNRNQGGIVQAEAALVQMSEDPHRVRTDLTSRLAEAFGRYETFRAQLDLYRDVMLPDMARVYQGVLVRFRQEYVTGPGTPGAPSSPTTVPGTSGTPAFTDVIVAQQTLNGAVTGYITALGSMWQAVVDVTDLMQTRDMFRLEKELQGTVPVAPLPDLEHLPALPGSHPCSPIPGLFQKPGDGTWPPPLPPPGAPTMPEAQARRAPQAPPAVVTAPAVPAPAPLPAPATPPLPDGNIPPPGTGVLLPDLSPAPDRRPPRASGS